MKNFIGFVVLLFTAALAVTACDDSGGGKNKATDTSIPGDVTMAQAVVSTSGIDLSWTDPDDTDLATLEITWQNATMTEPESGSAAAGDEAYSIPGTLGNEKYDITLTALDYTGNESGSVTFSLTPAVTEMTYYFIYTAADLYAVRGGDTSDDKYADWDLGDGYVLMADIGLSGYSALEGWVPLGDLTTRFTGVFEGNGHIISDLSINRPNADYQGLFGYLGGPGIINDLTVQGSVSGQSHVGGLVGTSEGTISGCVSEVAVTGNITDAFQDTGGLVGDNSGAVSDSSATGTVYGIYRVGGLIGFNDGGTVDNCHTSGAVTTNYDFAGGLVGRNEGGAISDSYATGAVTSTNNNAGGLAGAHLTGSITNCYATGSVSSPGSAGGLVGANTGDISSSHATGNVTGESYTGGLIGNMEGGTITSCYATGAVTGTDDYLGGLVGYINMGEIADSYSTGNVTGNTTNSDNVGGLVGGNNEASITGYHTTGTVTGHDNVGGLIGENTGGTIEDGSYSEGSVSGHNDVGGLMGYVSGIITGSHSDCTVTGYTSVGGLIGRTYGALIELSYATGSVTATAGTDNDYAGGLVGYCDNQSITNCYARGSVTGEGSLGGLIGYLYAGTVSYCYSTGAVIGTGGYRGGFVGYANPSVTASYYDSETSDMDTTDGASVNPRSTLEMKTQATYTSWDFAGETANGTNNYWSIGTLNNGYPYLTNNAPAQ